LREDASAKDAFAIFALRAFGNLRDFVIQTLS